MLIKPLALSALAALWAPMAMAGGPAVAAAEAPVAVPAPAPAASPFDGFWAGVSLGKGYSSIGVSAGIGPDPDVSVPFVGDILSLTYPDSGASGLVAGVEAGYGRSFGQNWYWGAQIDHMSTDLEADANLRVDLTNPIIGPNPYPPSGSTDFGYKVNIDSMTSALGRLGYRINDSSMIYGLGGITAARGSASLEGFNPGNADRDFDLAAVTLGLGVETMLGDKTSLKIEYRTTNLGDYEIANLSSQDPTVPLNFHASLTSRADSVRIVLVHRF